MNRLNHNFENQILKTYDIFWNGDCYHKNIIILEGFLHTKPTKESIQVHNSELIGIIVPLLLKQEYEIHYDADFNIWTILKYKISTSKRIAYITDNKNLETVCFRTIDQIYNNN